MDVPLTVEQLTVAADGRKPWPVTDVNPDGGRGAAAVFCGGQGACKLGSRAKIEPGV